MLVRCAPCWPGARAVRRFLLFGPPPREASGVDTPRNTTGGKSRTGKVGGGSTLYRRVFKPEAEGPTMLLDSHRTRHNGDVVLVQRVIECFTAAVAPARPDAAGAVCIVVCTG